jgi:hypothetical protein
MQTFIMAICIAYLYLPVFYRSDETPLSLGDDHRYPMADRLSSTSLFLCKVDGLGVYDTGTRRYLGECRTPEVEGMLGEVCCLKVFSSMSVHDVRATLFF